MPRVLLVALAVTAHLAVSLVAVVPGYVSVDEGTYHLMAKNVAEGRLAEIWNGYEELPSQELVVGALVVRGGRLVAAPPQPYALLAAPFYLALGYRGLFLLNALAYLITLAATWGIARHLFGDRRLAFDAILVLAFATFLWDYSQAAWPHATATCLVATAAWCLVRSTTAPTASAGTLWAVGCGVAAGIAPGMRLDSMFALPALLLPPLFARPTEWRRVGAILAGSAPGLLALAALNRLKFGAWSPLSYGKTDDSVSSGVGPWLALAGAALGLMAVAWIASRRRVGTAIQGRLPVVVAAAAALTVAGVLFVPQVWAMAWRLADGAWQLLVDFRGRPRLPPEPALGRSPGGAMLYIGGLKKSLLQSCPYLTVIVVPALVALHERASRSQVGLLLLVPAAYVVPYAFFAWHGGLSLNLRYFTPILPFTSVLTAWALGRMTGGGGRLSWRPVIVGAAAATAFFAVLVLGLGDRSFARLELALLDLPLAFAAAIILFTAAGAAVGRNPGRGGALRRSAVAAAAAGLAWAALVTFAYDVPLARHQRRSNLAVARELAPRIAPDSILFVPYPDPYFALIEIPRLRLAMPTRDRFASFRDLVDHHLARGRGVFAILPASAWRGLAADGALDGLVVRLVDREHGLAALEPASYPEDD